MCLATIVTITTALFPFLPYLGIHFFYLRFKKKLNALKSLHV